MIEIGPACDVLGEVGPESLYVAYFSTKTPERLPKGENLSLKVDASMGT